MKTNYRKAHLVFKESYRKPRTKSLKESKLNEQVQDEAYDIAEEMLKYFNSQNKHSFSRDEVDEQFALAVRKLYGIDNVWEIVDENGNIVINGKTFDGNELLESDIRGILSYEGWATIFEGDNEGGITDGEEVEESLKEEKDKPIKYVPQKSALRKALERFDSNGEFAKQGVWKIARGGYDLAFQLYYNDLAILDGINDGYGPTEIHLDQKAYNGYDTRTLAEFVCSVYKDCEIIDESLKEASYDDNKWLVDYKCKNGFEGEVLVTAFNKMMAYDVFEDIAKDFPSKVIAADIVRVDDDFVLDESLKEGKVKIVSVEQGTCPYCNSNNIDYGASDFVDDMVCYPAHCNDCDRDFEEWYKLDFAGHNVGTGLDIEAKVGQEVEVEESLKEADEKVQDEPTKSFKDDVKEAMKTLKSIDPKVFYTALGIYEWTEERDPSQEVCEKVYEFLDGVDTIYDEYVRGEVQDIVEDENDFPTDDEDEMEFFTDEEEE